MLLPTVAVPVVPVVPGVEVRLVATVEEDMVAAMEILQDQEPSRPGGNLLTLLGWLFFAALESLALQRRKEGFGHSSHFTTLTTFTTQTLAPTSHSIAYLHVPRTPYFAHNFSLNTPAWDIPHRGAASINGLLQSQGECLALFNRNTIDSVGALPPGPWPGLDQFARIHIAWPLGI